MQQVKGSLLLLLLGAAAWAQPPFQWAPVPGAIESVAGGEPIEAAGFPVRIQAVRSSKGFEELLAYFARSFVSGGLYVAPFEKQTQQFRQVHLTGLDTQTQVAYTVFFQLNPDKTTTVVMTEAALEKRRTPQRPENNLAPVFPGARNPLVSQFEGSRSLLYSVVGARPEEIYGFYREVLSTSGYAEGAIGTFSRHGEELEVIAHTAGGGVNVIVISRPTQADSQP